MAAAAAQQPLQLLQHLLTQQLLLKSQLEQEVIRTSSSYGWQRQVGFCTCHRQLFCSAKIELFAG
jgi:hypothetical protein